MFLSIEFSSDGMGLRKDGISLPVSYRILKSGPFNSHSFCGFLLLALSFCGVLKLSVLSLFFA